MVGGVSVDFNQIRRIRPTSILLKRLNTSFDIYTLQINYFFCGYTY